MAEPNRQTAPDAAEAVRPAAGWVSGRMAGAVVAVALAVGAYALTRLDSWGEQATSVPARLQLDLGAQAQVPAEAIGYTEQGSLPTHVEEPRALVAAPDGTLYVAGDQAVAHVAADGVLLATLALPEPPRCLAALADAAGTVERLVVAGDRRVVVVSPTGAVLGQWPELAEKSVITALAATPHHVVVADAGLREVRICDLAGTVQQRIGTPDPDRNMPGFVLPSPYFDVVCGDDETLWVVNSGMRRIECYSLSGELQSMWGEASSDLAGFFGCCNPAHLARLPDGRFVTSEKGIPRIKVFSAIGELETVVAGPRELGLNATALVDARGDAVGRAYDVAVRPDGAVLVLDTKQRRVRVFQPRAEGRDPT
ncbi:MAG: hypothetical protein MUF48_06655 [Pirellulaceae bacterium]|nr:hypothetical protein [Pirellulaceae bacterium]